MVFLWGEAPNGLLNEVTAVWGAEPQAHPPHKKINATTIASIFLFLFLFVFVCVCVRVCVRVRVSLF